MNIEINCRYMNFTYIKEKRASERKRHRERERERERKRERERERKTEIIKNNVKVKALSNVNPKLDANKSRLFI